MLRFFVGGNEQHAVLKLLSGSANQLKLIRE
jgi:hypothetical protein